jgi:chromosome segregation ATPase
MNKSIVLILFFISFNSIAQKTDVRVEIFNLKEDVKKLQTENQKLSTDLSTSTNKYENRIVDLGSKIEDLRFEINVLKRLIEQYRNGENVANSAGNLESTSSQKNSTTEESQSEKSEIKPKYQSSTQCSATTKKGTRCSRSARSNGLCWQHGG